MQTHQTRVLATALVAFHQHRGIIIIIIIIKSTVSIGVNSLAAINIATAM